jgi:hypothetical protein
LQPVRGASSPSRLETMNAASAVTASGGLISLTQPESFLRHRLKVLTASPCSWQNCRAPTPLAFQMVTISPQNACPCRGRRVPHRRFSLNVLIFHRIALVLTKAPPSHSECRDSRRALLTLTYQNTRKELRQHVSYWEGEVIKEHYEYGY